MERYRRPVDSSIVSRKYTKHPKSLPLPTGLWNGLSVSQRKRLASLGFEQQAWDNNVQEIIVDTHRWPLKDEQPISLVTHDRSTAAMVDEEDIVTVFENSFSE